ncbi:DUF6950 family protein [Neorhizobium petrolearium]|uniref:DUF6950 domain-containing protein n=1 Tax=Neorhizobium petrolearium TaxID=515361 RepID=A0ABY8M289_9HYPH|nr:hypothetical protein [Neorhizobium petrolearium]MCC2608395.1 hypothetical protein [Neorhizobium petrolearium]WGI68673.1 hypothetical protein QEO92_00805 [Neorhizobium petrolearium]
MRETDLLDRYLAEEKEKTFRWGEENGDCLLFLLGWAELAAGAHASRPWRGEYGDHQGAWWMLERFGGAIAAVIDVLGPPRLGSDARRGDIGLMAANGWHLGMICTGSMWVLRAGTRGVKFTRSAPDICWDLRFS